MKKLIDKIKLKITKWFNDTVIPWLKAGWMHIVNILIVFIAYANLDIEPAAQALVGFWGFILIGYYIFWKLFGADKVVTAYIKQQKEHK